MKLENNLQQPGRNLLVVVVGIKHESMRKGQTSHKKEHNTRMCFPLKPVFTRDKGGLPNFIDEPTSNLDSLNEGIILKSLKESSKNQTVVLVSHRTSTMNVADVVYEMENGRIS